MRNTVIRHFVAAGMLLVFAFSITPKILLHNWFANHKDSVPKPTDDQQQQVSKVLYNCNCDNTVAESPFTYQPNYFELPGLQIFSLQQEPKPVSFYSGEYFFFSRRGPPSMS